MYGFENGKGQGLGGIFDISETKIITYIRKTVYMSIAAMKT
jgi:hypothetical protein